MKRSLSTILIIIIFIAGGSIFLYPAISNFLYEKNASQAIQEHKEKIDSMSPEEMKAEKKAVKEYNKSLVDNAVVLTDPFDPDAFPITVGNYKELLARDEVMGYIEIPCIDVNLPIYHGTSDEVLEKGAGHLENTSLPMGGESTHAVISAHCGLPSARLFTDLISVEKGDTFNIYVLDEILTYQVYDIEKVLPDDTSSLLIEKERDLATLITCTPYGENTHRLLVHGKRIKTNTQSKVTSKNHAGMPWERIMKYAAMAISLLFLIIVLAELRRNKKRK